MHQVFISYQNADRELTEQLAHGPAAGFATWYYDRDSRVGFNYMEYLNEVIQECQAMVRLISPHSVHSTRCTGLESDLTRLGASLLSSPHLKPGMKRAREIEQEIRSPDIVVPLLSAASIHSKMP